MIKYKFNSDKTMDIYDHTDTKIATIQPPQRLPGDIIDAVESDAMDALKNDNIDRWRNLVHYAAFKNIEEIDSEDEL